MVRKNRRVAAGDARGVAGSGEDGVGAVAVVALEIVALHAVLGLALTGDLADDFLARVIRIAETA